MLSRGAASRRRRRNGESLEPVSTPRNRVSCVSCVNAQVGFWITQPFRWIELHEFCRYPSSGRRELRDYLHGTLEEDAARSIDDHLVTCDQCNDFLEGVSEEEPFLRLIQSAWPGKPLDQTMPDEVVAAPQPMARTPASGTRSNNRIGKYEIIDELGRGGMGVGYRAIDTELKRPVALKVIVAGEHSSDAMRTRFQREAEAIARLQHNGIVQIFEVGEAHGQPYLALELVRGPLCPSLSTRSRNQFAGPPKWYASSRRPCTSHTTIQSFIATSSPGIFCSRVAKNHNREASTDRKLRVHKRFACPLRKSLISGWQSNLIRTTR